MRRLLLVVAAATVLAALTTPASAATTYRCAGAHAQAYGDGPYASGSATSAQVSVQKCTNRATGQVTWEWLDLSFARYYYDSTGKLIRQDGAHFDSNVDPSAVALHVTAMDRASLRGSVQTTFRRYEGPRLESCLTAPCQWTETITFSIVWTGVGGLIDDYVLPYKRRGATVKGTIDGVTPPWSHGGGGTDEGGEVYIERTTY